MRKPRRRPTYYEASTLYDGTVLAAVPQRRPSPRILRRDHHPPDEDGVFQSSPRNGKELSDPRYDGRTRFQDIIATNLNTRRALRELVLPAIAELHAEIAALRQALNQSLTPPPPP